MLWMLAAFASETTLRGLLLAHHPQDLPPASVIERHGGADALWSLAQRDQLLVVRARALTLMRQFDGQQQRCAGVVSSQAHPKVRASALVCLGGHALTEAQRQVVTLASTDPDPRVRHAALEVGVQTRVPSGE